MLKICYNSSQLSTLVHCIFCLVVPLVRWMEFIHNIGELPTKLLYLKTNYYYYLCVCLFTWCLTCFYFFSNGKSEGCNYNDNPSKYLRLLLFSYWTFRFPQGDVVREDKSFLEISGTIIMKLLHFHYSLRKCLMRT